ncbi:MAG: mechanosensitive ion channel domain-containing protein [Thermoanaerobaculia bacterium]
MTFRNLPVLTALILIPAVLAPWARSTAAQTEVPSAKSQRSESADNLSEETVDLVSDVERLLRHERVMDLDRVKLEEVRLDLEKRQTTFEALGAATYERAVEVEAKKKELQDLGETGDPDARSALEATILELEADLELYKTQSDLALTAESTIRRQIEALEKKLERHQRAVDVLRGVAPAAPAPSSESQVGLATPSGPSISMPGFPVSPGAGKVSEPEQAAPRLESTVQIEARREFDRRQAAVEDAELAVIEYVKRRESLQQQVEFESVLLDAAQRSVENLAEALERRQSQLSEKTAVGADPAEIAWLQRTIPKIEEMLIESRDEIEARHEHLASLDERLEKQQKEEQRVTQEVEARRREVKEAKNRLYWLESPIHPANVMRWVRERGPRILAVIIVAVVLLTLLRLSVRRIARVTVRKRRGERALTVNRADTLALSFRSAATVLIMVGAAVLVLQEAGIDVKTVLGGAAILGFALAFGAQNLMRDYFTGFMILLEDQYELGDLVTIENITGTVEKVNMRTTMLRDLEGRVHFIPNGEVKSVTNRSYVWGRAVIEVPVGYQESVDHVMEVLIEVAEDLRADPEFGAWITDDPVMLGVDKFTEYGVVIKFMLKTLPDKPFPVRRQMLRRVKNKFDEEGIVISVPHRMLLQPKDDTGPPRS